MVVNGFFYCHPVIIHTIDLSFGGISLICPVCGGKATGKVGMDQFYCWDCCVEYRLNKEGVQIFEVAEDGSLMAFDPHNEVLL